MIKPKRSHLLLLWCSLLLAGQAQSESVSVDFCIPDYADLMSMETANQFLQQAASQGVKVRFHDAKGEGRRQLEQLSKAKGETVFVIPTEDCDRQAMLDSARAKGQRLVYLNAPPESKDFKAYADLWYVGSAKGECAKALGQVISGYLKANPWHDLDGDGQLKILYFKGPAKSQRAQELMDDLKTELLQQKLEFSLLDPCTECTFSYQSSYRYVEKLCDQEEFETFDLMVAATDDLALGAIDAFEDHKPGFLGSFNLPVFSMDGMLQTHDYLQQGLLTATVSRQVQQIARQALTLCRQEMPTAVAPDIRQLGRQFFVPVKILMFNPEDLKVQEKSSSSE